MFTALSQGEKEKLAGIGKLFADAGEKIFLVGGSVRNLAVGLSLKDADLCTSADPDRIFRVLRKGRDFEAIYDKSPAKGFGTVGARLEQLELDITPFRTRKGAQNFSDPLVEDLSWRDFTINAIAADLDPEKFLNIIDPFKGLEALEQRRLRTPRPPLETLEDDPLRVLRAARFLCLGFELDREFEAAVPRAVPWLQDPNRISSERVRDELARIVSALDPGAGMEKLHDWGLISWLMPGFDLEYGWGLRVRMLRAMESRAEEPIRGLMALMLGAEMQPGSRAPSPRAAMMLGQSRRLSKLQARRISDLVRVLPQWLLWDPVDDRSDPVGWIVHEAGDVLTFLLNLDKAAVAAGIDNDNYVQVRKKRIERIQSLPPETLEKYIDPPLPLNGREVAQALGLELTSGGGGPAIGQAMEFMKDLVIRDKLEPDDTSAAREKLQQWKETREREQNQ